MTPRDARLSAQTACRSLAATYASSRLGNPSNPLDDVVFIILSNRTTPTLSIAAYRALKAYGPWSRIAKASTTRVARLIARAGLSQKKARWIRALLHELTVAFGRPTLRPLAAMPAQQQLDFLCGLPGVSVKVAKCVMMYTLGAEVLPVDVHVHRIATRLGWTNQRRADASSDELEILIPPKARFRFHVDAIQHGRAVCRARAPRCNACCLSAICARVGV